jgi:hypothetical protein
MKATCPHCQAVSKFERKHAGKYTDCPTCGEEFSVPRAKTIGEYMVAVIFLSLPIILLLSLLIRNKNVVVSRGVWLGQGRSVDDKRPTFEKTSIHDENITLKKFVNVYSSDSQRPGSAKIKAEHIGKIVKWNGFVSDIGMTKAEEKFYVKFTNPVSSGKDVVVVYFHDSQIEHLLKLKKGDPVTYFGTITGSTLQGRGISLFNGDIFLSREY